MNQLNRRQFTGVLAAGALTGMPRASRARTRSRSREILETRVISHQTDLYHGWPTLARRASGELVLVCSGGREQHVCPFGRVELMRSHDNGQTWSWPEVVLDGPIDDRDAGVVETAGGSLLVTTFTSLAYEPSLASAEGSGAWDPSRLARWRAAHERVGEQGRRAALGVWMTRSTDGGLTWSARFDCRVNSPHGPIQLADGRLLYAGKDLWREGTRVGVCHSSDDGATWSWLADIPARDGDRHADYHELHAVEAPSGKLVVHIRNHNAANARETLQSESTDGGRTWSRPHAIGVWGLPSHLLRLRDGRLLMSYGHRRAPLGNQARVSDDEGNTWGEPILLSDDGTSGDLGYPSTVQISDDVLVSVWYEKLRDLPRAVLRQATWRVPGASSAG